jgi:hypothetical protein
MPIEPISVLLTSCRRRAAVAVCTTIIGICFAASASAADPYANADTAAGWAWARVSRGERVDFNARCQTTTLDSRSNDETRWTDHCRQLPSSFLVDVLTRKPWRDGIQSAGVHLIGAAISGDVNLSFATLNHALILENCRILKGIDLSHARTDSVVNVTESNVLGAFSAEEFYDDMSLVIDGSEFHNSVLLRNSRIVGDLSMEGSMFDGDLNANSLQVGGLLSMRSTPSHIARAKSVSIRAARVTGNAQFVGVDFDGDLDADQLQVGGSFLMRSTDQNRARFQGVILQAAKVAGNVEMDGATLNKELQADGLTVGGYLLMQSVGDIKASFEGVRLVGARIGRDVQMNHSAFNDVLDGNSLEVGANLMLRQAVVKHSAQFGFAKIGLSMDVRGATLAELKLSGATIAQDLILGSTDKTYPAVVWRTPKSMPGSLSLRNTHIGALADSEDAWPERSFLHLDGFTFARLGGGTGNAGPEMRSRDMKWWDQWIRRDPDYSPMPYEQLAKALEGEGDRDRADDIRYLGRVRQRETETGGSRILDGFLEYVAGFGIGGYTFRVLYWVLGISLAGGIYLWTCVPTAREHGRIWCFGASLSRLLPVVEINKEFSDFFDDPERKRLSGRQSFVFAVIAMVGWVLGAILVAAVSGLTQKP